MKRNFILLVGLMLLSACASVPAETQVKAAPSQMAELARTTPSPTAKPSNPGYSLTSPCGLPPITIPAMPAVIPGYTELDEATGLHVTGKPIAVDLQTYHLKIDGLVNNPLDYNFEELRCLPRVTVKASLECPGFFIDQTTWSGVPIATLLNQAGLKKTAKQIVMISADGYQTYVPIKDALNEHNFLAYEWMGQPVPVLHGFPVRAVFPQLTGFAWVKWLVEIRVE
jgi:DMSO/TMAO reductase YedYZ molybdopterin-dependent catalytic subunit